MQTLITAETYDCISKSIHSDMIDKILKEFEEKQMKETCEKTEKDKKNADISSSQKPNQYQSSKN